MPIEITIRMVADNAAAMAEQLKTLVQDGFVVPTVSANAVDTPDKTPKDAASGTAFPANSPTGARRPRGRPRASGPAAPANGTSHGGDGVAELAAADEAEDTITKDTATNETLTVEALEAAEKAKVRDMVDRITKAFKTGDADQRARVVAWRKEVGLELVKSMTVEHLPAAEKLIQELGA